MGLQDTQSGRGEDRGIAASLQILKGKQKTSKGASAYVRFFNRPFGRVLAAVAHSLGLTPNIVTAISALATFGGLAVLAFSPVTPVTGLLVAALLVLGYAFDSADGQLARLRGGGSFAGEWLDHVVDAAKMSLFHLVVLFAWARTGTESGLWLVLPGAYAFLAAFFFCTIMLTDQLRRAHRGSSGMRLAGEGSSSVPYSLAVLPTEYGVLACVFVLWGWPALFQWVYLALFVCNVLFLCLALPKWYRELSGFGRT
jgi:phosphatidylglycerophosphate synthase